MSPAFLRPAMVGKSALCNTLTSRVERPFRHGWARVTLAVRYATIDRRTAMKVYQSLATRRESRRGGLGCLVAGLSIALLGLPAASQAGAETTDQPALSSGPSWKII